MDKNTINSIIKKHDAKRLCELSEPDFGDFMMAFTYDYLHKTDFEKLTDVQKQVLACRMVDDMCQAGSILSSAKDKKEFFLLPAAQKGFLEIGAEKTAEALGEFIALMPEGTFESNVLPKLAWFDEEENRKNEISRIDSLIASCPDGNIWTLFHKFISSDEKKAEELLSGIAEDAVLRTGAESLRIAIGSLVVFVIIAAGYCVARFAFGFEFLAISGFPRTWVSAVAVGAMCPLFLSLFFFGRYCKECGKSKIAYELLTSISAILLAASLLHMLLSLMGVLG